MAQKYNPSTGQWEEEEDDGSLTSGTAAAFGGGSAPAVDGSAMTAGIPQFSNGAFSNPQYNLNSLPEGYEWGSDDYLTSQGITKKYANPWDTKYSYMKGEQDLGFGYDDYNTAISKLAFNSGKMQVPELAPVGAENEYGMPVAGTPGSPGGWTHSAYYTPASSGWDADSGQYNTPEVRGATFGTEQELYDYMLKDVSTGSPLAFNTTGYGIQDGVLQNIFAQYNAGATTGAVPDMVNRRVVYPGVQPAGGYNVSGDAAMVDSTPLFGPDGKVIGYKSDLNRDHTRYADTSGRQHSTTAGATNYSDDMKNIVRMIDDQYGFISAADKDKFGFNTTAQNTYSKEAGGFEKFLKMAAPIALAAFLGPQMFGPAVGAAGAGEAALAGGLDIGALLGESVGMGFSPAAGLSFSPASSLGSLAEIGAGFGGAGLSSGLGALEGLGGLGLEGLPGMVSDLGSLFGETIGQGFTPASGLEFNPTSSIGSTGIGAGQGGLGFASELGVNMDLGSVFAPAAEALSNSPEIMGPPEVSEMPGQFVDDWGGGTNGMGEFTNGKGMLSPQDRIATAMRSLGMERDLAANLTQGGSKMYNFMTQSPGKAGMFKAPSPLEMLYKGGKAFMDYRSNKDAMGMYEDQLNKVRSYQDPNRARGDFANKQWQQGISDPMAGYQDFMMGGGRQFIDQARAQAAKGGKRGSYINSGKMNSDLASLYMKNQIERQNMLKGGFASSPNNEETTMKYMGPLMDMERNKYAPFGQAIDSVMRGFQLSDLFGG